MIEPLYEWIEMWLSSNLPRTTTGNSRVYPGGEETALGHDVSQPFALIAPV